jgi:hypothetical protein
MPVVSRIYTAWLIRLRFMRPIILHAQSEVTLSSPCSRTGYPGWGFQR